MDIETFKEIIALGEGPGMEPCKEGWRWLLEMTKGCKTSSQFFNKCKKEIKQDRIYESYDYSHYIADVLSPHAYLIYMFKFSLDWEGIGYSKAYSFDCADPGYIEFIQKHWGVNETLFIPIPDLCDALKRAFK